MMQETLSLCKKGANLVILGTVFFQYFLPALASSLLQVKFSLGILIPSKLAMIELLRSSNNADATFGPSW